MNQLQQANFMLNAAQLGEVLCTSSGAEDGIHQLESLAFGLRHEEVDEEYTEKEPAGEEEVQTPEKMSGKGKSTAETDVPRNGFEHGGNKQSDSEVVHPVRACSNSRTLRSSG
jgi:hypothetical protein